MLILFVLQYFRFRHWDPDNPSDFTTARWSCAKTAMLPRPVFNVVDCKPTERLYPGQFNRENVFFCMQNIELSVY